MNINTLKTTILLTSLTLLLVFIGSAIGGRQGAMMAFVFAAVMNMGAYWFSDKIVLGMYRATPLTEADAPAIHRMVRELAEKAKIPMPAVYRIPMKIPNAFATGRSPAHAVVAVTDGILELLTEDELRGVLAHELSHVLHRDILISSVAATVAGAIGMLASMMRWSLMMGGGRRDSREGGAHPLALLAAVIFAPLAATLIQLAVSRSREFHADEGGAHLSGDPLLLASALKKLEARVKSGLAIDPVSEENPAAAHLFIVSPLRGDSFTKLFSTHPPLAERVRRLEALAEGR